MITTISYLVLAFIVLVALTSFAYASGRHYTDRTLQRSHELGYNQGKEKGHDEGYLEGFKEGREIGHNEGYKQGKEEGFADGKRYGASVKYNEEALKEMGVEFGGFNKL